MDWYVWRVLTHPKIKATMSDLENWSFTDLLDAHDVLDALEEAESSIYRKARSGSK